MLCAVRIILYALLKMELLKYSALQSSECVRKLLMTH